MKIKTKILLSTFIFYLTILHILYFSSYNIILKRFEDIENESMISRIKSVEQIIDDDLTDLDFTNQDYANWDQAYDYVLGKNKDFENEFPKETIKRIRTNLILILDSNYNILYQKYYDFNNDMILEIPESLLDKINNRDSNLINLNQNIKGIFFINEIPALYSSQPIRDNTGNSPPAGIFIMIRYLDKYEIERLSKTINLSFDVLNYSYMKLNSPQKLKLPSEQETFTCISNGNNINLFSLYNDIWNNPNIVITIQTKRNGYIEGKRTVNYFLIAVSLLSLFSIILFINLINQFVLKKVFKMKDDVINITKNLDVTQKIYYKGNDELSELALSINKLLNTIEEYQQDLLKSEKMYKSIFECTATPMLIINNDRIINLANTEFTKFSGYSKEEIENKLRLCDFMHENDVKKLQADFSNIFSDSKFIIYSNEFKLILNQKKERYVIMNLATIANTRNIIVSILDIDKIKRAELSLIETNQRLLEIDRLKTDFINMISHEIRTPLTSILGFSNLVKKRINNIIFPLINKDDIKLAKSIQQIIDNVEIIISESKRLTNLINDVLDLSKIESGKIDWDMKSFSIVEAINHSLSATSLLYEVKGLNIIKKIAHNTPYVYGDKDRIIQVMINLISNAVKFTNNGSITIESKFDDRYVYISVIDTGIGIAEENIPKIFDKFNQIYNNNLQYKPSGTGLGLAICKQIVEYHRGRIWVESSVNVGSNFTFTLPISNEIILENQPNPLTQIL
ncbi:Sensor protein kinase WalK [Caloramator mitchellensis]|uniref:Circadian input-output histidine kinase CikA n=1 Tax=Caloramator mitchellensis TaxID=908809 RepID=A0A0R3JVC1_CALMK|nr:ATP-binding protein [Caloramator mitchellensis]KRQ87545.1 Sensor protein kinase WalK [Caloramator mitchellensis]